MKVVLEKDKKMGRLARTVAKQSAPGAMSALGGRLASSKLVSFAGSDPSGRPGVVSLVRVHKYHAVQLVFKFPDPASFPTPNNSNWQI